MNEVIERLKKILRLAKAQAGLPEGEAAMAKAQELMMKYGVTMETINKPENAVEANEMFVENTNSWHMMLIGIICEFTHCAAVRDGRRKVVDILGAPQNTLIAEYLYDVLRRHIIYDRKRRTDGSTTREFEHTAVKAIREKMREINRKQQQQIVDSTTAMVLARREKEMIAEFSAQRYGRLGQGSAVRGSGYSRDGYTSGRNAPLNTAMSGNGKAALRLTK